MSTSFPSASKASSRAVQPVEPQNTTVTEETPVGNRARTGIGSSAIALRIPFRPEGMCGKNMSFALALLRVGAFAGVNTTPFSSQDSIHRPVISAFSKSKTTWDWAKAKRVEVSRSIKLTPRPGQRDAVSNRDCARRTSRSTPADKAAFPPSRIGMFYVISKPRIVPVEEAKPFASIPMRCSMETNKLGNG